MLASYYLVFSSLVQILYIVGNEVEVLNRQNLLKTPTSRFYLLSFMWIYVNVECMMLTVEYNLKSGFPVGVQCSSCLYSAE